MPIKLLTLLLLVFTTIAAYAQTGTLSGKLIDTASKKPLPLATVTVRQGDEIINFKLTADDGTFKVPLLPLNKPLQASITFVGYRSIVKTIQLGSEKGLDLGTLSMAAGKELQEVVISAQRPPIVVRRDTVEFNADAFKMMPNALVEDLFKKLPGFRIDKDGKLTVNGKRVKRLLVDSREFFGGGTATAMKNLDAATIDKVQVTENTDELKYGIQNIEDKGQEVTINLTLKKWAKRGIVGKAGLGAGTHKTYDASVIGNIFRDTLQLSLIGFTNNRNKGSFSYQDLSTLGGFNRSGISSLSENSEGAVQVNDINFGGFGSGLNKEAGGGINYNNLTKRGLESNLQYFYGRVHNTTQSYRNLLQQLPNELQLRQTGNLSDGTVEKHTANGSIYTKLGKSKRNSLSVKPTYQQNTDNTGQDYYTTVRSGTGSGTPVTGVGASIRNNNKGDAVANSTVYTYQSPGKKTTFSLSNDLSYTTQDDKGSGTYRDTLYSGGNTGFNAYSNTISDNSKEGTGNLAAKVSYRQKHWSYALGLRSSYEHLERTLTNGSTATTTQAGDAGSIKRNLWSHLLSSEITFNIPQKVTVTFIPNVVRFDSRARYSNYHNVDLVGWRFLPAVRMYLFKSLNINYGAGVQTPENSNLLAVQNTFNPLVTIKGNPDLKVRDVQNLTLSYNKYVSKISLQAYVWASYRHEKNAVITAYETDATGHQTLTPQNIKSLDVLKLNPTLKKDFKLSKDWSIVGSVGLYLVHNNSEANINRLQTKTKVIDFSHWYSAILQYKALMELEVRASPYLQRTYYDKYFPDLTTHATRYSSELKLNFSSRFMFRNNFDIQDFSQSFGPSRHLYQWNAALDYMFLKNKKAMLSLSAHDLLNQAKSFTTEVTPTSSEFVRTNILPRYFFLAFSYNLKGFTGPRKATAKFDLW